MTAIRASKGGVRYRRVGERPKTIHGLFGWVTYVRTCYARVASGGAGWRRWTNNYHRHRAVEFRNFLTVIGKAVKDDL